MIFGALAECLAKAASAPTMQFPPGAGWQPIPGGTKGGYRRRHGTGWEYWYPKPHVSRQMDLFGEHDSHGQLDLFHGGPTRDVRPNLRSIPGGRSKPKRLGYAKAIRRHLQGERGPSLTDALKSDGFTHQPHPGGMPGRPRQVLDAHGVVVFEGPATEAWQWLRQVRRWRQPDEVATSPKPQGAVEALQAFDASNRDDWHAGLHAAHALEWELLQGDRRGEQPPPVQPRRGLIGLLAKRRLEELFEGEGYYGAGHEQDALTIWRQKVEGLQGILDETAHLGHLGGEWTQTVDTLRRSIGRLKSARPIFEAIDEITDGERFAAYSRTSAADLIRDALKREDRAPGETTSVRVRSLPEAPVWPAQHVHGAPGLVIARHPEDNSHFLLNHDSGQIIDTSMLASRRPSVPELRHVAEQIDQGQWPRNYFRDEFRAAARDYGGMDPADEPFAAAEAAQLLREGVPGAAVIRRLAKRWAEPPRERASGVLAAELNSLEREGWRVVRPPLGATPSSEDMPLPLEAARRMLQAGITLRRASSMQKGLRGARHGTFTAMVEALAA